MSDLINNYNPVGNKHLEQTEYIRKQDAINTIMGQPPDAHYPSWYATQIAELPPADVAPIKHGKWILVKGTNGKDYHKCSECLHTQEITGVKNYCAVCGARMDGKGEG